MTVPEAKTALRREMRARLQNLTRAERAAASALICERVRAQALWHSAQTVLLFAPMPDEVDVWPLLTMAVGQGKAVALPRFDPVQRCYVAAHVKDLESDLITGAFGIREPSPHCPQIPLASLDLVLVPGLAFDATGRRLGRGKGFYDRLLANVPGIKCGVAFGVHLAAEVPSEPHDVRMAVVITETNSVGCQCPGGTIENSPAFQCRVQAGNGLESRRDD